MLRSSGVLHLVGKASALVASASVHAVLALAFLSAAPHAPVTTLGPVPLDAAEVELVEVALQPLSNRVEPRAVSPAAVAVAHHSHAYPLPPGHDSTPHDASLRHLEPLVDAGRPELAPPPTVLAAPAPPRFVLSAGVGSATASGQVSSGARAGGAEENAVSRVVPEALVNVPARLLRGAPPRYTAEAEAAGVEAGVALEIVVDSAGAVSSARVLSPVGYGLDEAALRGVRGYRFLPARRAEKPVPVRMRWVVRFQLR